MSKQLLVFSADWCGPCKMYKPVLEDFQEGHRDIDVLIFNVDEAKDMADKYGVRGVPTSILVTGHDESTTKVGALSKSQLEAWVASAA